MDKTYCVYKHTTPSGKVYIGVTCKKPNRRWSNGNGYVNNKHFYAAIQKYGWENIEHKVVANNLTKEQASEMERTLILSYKSNDPNYGYNHTTGGYDGYELNDAQLKALSERAHKQFSDEAFKAKFDLRMKDPDRRKKISVGLKKYYESQEAREKASQAQKKKWENKEYRERTIKEAKERCANPEYRKKLSKILKEKRSCDEYRQSMMGGKNPNAKCVLQYSLNGELLERFDSIADACRKYNCNHSNIIACIKGRCKTSYGYKWQYADTKEEAVL